MKVIKIILLSLLTLVVLLVAGLAAAVTFIDLNQHKDRIAALVHQQTGRELRLEGDLEWGIWPRLRLAGGGLVLGNAEGFGPEPFLELDSFSLAVNTWPLLRSEVRMELVEVSGLRLDLRRNAQGVGNWQDLLPEPVTPAVAAPAPAEPTLPFAALALGGVDIQDVRVDWHDATSGQRAAIHDLNLQIGALELGEPINLEMAFQAESNQPELAAAGNITGTLVYDLGRQLYSLQPLEAELALSGPTVPGDQADITLRGLFDLDEKAGRARIEDFRLEGLGMLVGAQLEMEGLNGEQPGYRGEIQADINDLVRVLETFESPLGQQLATVRERTVTLETTFDAHPAEGRIKIEQLVANLLGTTISGNLQASELTAAQPRVQGRLQAEGPDLPALLAVAARLTPGANLDALPRALQGLRDRSLLLEADFSSNQDEIVIPNLRFKGLATELTGNWRLREPLGATPRIKGQWRLTGDDLPLLLRLAATMRGGPDQPSGNSGANSAGRPRIMGYGPTGGRRRP
ncbi:MAG: AsmA family protein [Desulfurivibrio sp.]|nr:AsmA family protein [Desulfurivibrio sp.]